MFAIAFDLVVADTARHHPKGVSQADADIGGTLVGFGFNRVQGNPLYQCFRRPRQLVRRDHGAEGVALVARLGA